MSSNSKSSYIKLLFYDSKLREALNMMQDRNVDITTCFKILILYDIQESSIWNLNFDISVMPKDYHTLSLIHI